MPAHKKCSQLVTRINRVLARKNLAPLAESRQSISSRDADRIRHKLNTDVVRRMLIRYFHDKGFEDSFDRLLYPTTLMDLIDVVPQLASYVEVEPYCVSIDPIVGKAVLGWSLYVLGAYRCFLGKTRHTDLSELARDLSAGVVPQSPGASDQTTPRQVIDFITRVLESHQSGYVDLAVSPNVSSGTTPGSGLGSGSFYDRGADINII